jgi:hypothetical protein
MGTGGRRLVYGNFISLVWSCDTGGVLGEDQMGHRFRGLLVDYSEKLDTQWGSVHGLGRVRADSDS